MFAVVQRRISISPFLPNTLFDFISPGLTAFLARESKVAFAHCLLPFFWEGLPTKSLPFVLTQIPKGAWWGQQFSRVSAGIWRKARTRQNGSGFSF